METQVFALKVSAKFICNLVYLVIFLKTQNASPWRRSVTMQMETEQLQIISNLPLFWIVYFYFKYHDASCHYTHNSEASTEKKLFLFCGKREKCQQPTIICWQTQYIVWFTCCKICLGAWFLSTVLAKLAVKTTCRCRAFTILRIIYKLTYFLMNQLPSVIYTCKLCTAHTKSWQISMYYCGTKCLSSSKNPSLWEHRTFIPPVTH